MPRLLWSEWFASPRRRLVVCVVFAGLLLRVFYLIQFRESLLFDVAIGPDVQEYHTRAMEILAGRVMDSHEQHHAPFYSWVLAGLLALTNGRIPGVRVLQLLLNFAAWLGLFFLLLRSAAIAWKTAFAFLCLAMLYPITMYQQGQLVSESILLPILTGALWLLTLAGEARQPRSRLLLYVGAGALCGLAAITHPLTLAFAAATVAYTLFRRQFRAAAAIAAGVALLVVPVSALNSWRAQRPVLIQSGGAFNVWLGNNAEATGGCYVRPGPGWERLHLEAKQEAARRQISVDRVWWSKTFDFVARHPLQAGSLLLRKAVLTWHYRELISGADPEYAFKDTGVMLYGAILTLPLFVFAWIGLWFTWHRRLFPACDWFALLLAALWLAQILTVTSARYRVAMMPAILLFAAIGLTMIDWRRWSLPPLFLLGVSCLLQLPMLGRGEAASLYGEAAYRKGDYGLAYDLLYFAAKFQNHPQRYDNLLGSAAQAMGNLPLAETHYRHAIVAVPDHAQAWMNMANLAAGFPERAEEAERLYLHALQLNPDYADLHFNYAHFLLQTERPAKALPHFQAAIELAPEHAAAWNGLGIAILFEGENGAAVDCFEQAVRHDRHQAEYLNNLIYACRAAGQSDRIPALIHRMERLQKSSQ